MWEYPENFDVIVIGGGHGGCEAAYIAAKKGVKTLFLTMNVDTIAKPSCNPSIGGLAKSHIVREIDILGGLMAKITDRAAIHYRMLNSSKGPAVQAPRAQIDKAIYHREMKNALEKTKNLEIKQHLVEELIVKKDIAIGVTTKEGIIYYGNTIILSTGTFLKGKIFIGDLCFKGGRNPEPSSDLLSSSLKKLGIKIGRLKTGTPPRIYGKSIDFSKVKTQSSEKNIQFSFDKVKKQKKMVNCYITSTSLETKKIIENNIKKSALFSGKIEGIGPRYCPSIEDKIKKFPHKDKHLIYLEPEGLHTDEFYINGASSSMPIEIQLKIIKSIEGLSKVKMIRPAYAIEYDYVESGQIYNTLETKLIKNLFLAGQINGTTGYEEAAGQGIIAGINAANRVLNKDLLYLKRSQSYIGVMIDDLTTKDIKEPYRVFTSRAEYRLLIRQDNADIRLFSIAYKEKLISKKKYQQINEKKEIIKKEILQLERTFKTLDKNRVSLSKILARPTFSYEKLRSLYPEEIKNYPEEITKQIETEIKYKGYIKKQEKDIAKLQQLEKINIPKNFCYDKIIGMKKEAIEKLKIFSPKNLAIASRIGLSYADLFVLMIAIKKQKNVKI